jgi:MFS family permease
MAGTRGYGEFKQGWPVVLSALLGIGLGLSPLPYYTMGVFAPHLKQAFGWSIGQIMAGLTVTSLMTLWAGPLVGILAIRCGVRWVALISLVLFSLAFMALGLSNGSLPLYYLTWAAIAVLGAGTLPITWTRAVNDWFDIRKGLALGISMMGTGLFGFLCKPLLAFTIGAFGWRWSYFAIALLPLLIAFPAAFFLFRDTGGSAAKSIATQKTSPPSAGLTLLQALRDWRFWLIAAALVPVSLCLGGPVPNLENILKGGGIGHDQIVQLASLVGLAALTGRVVGGWLLDRFWAPGVALVIIALPAVSCLVLAQASLNVPTAAAAIIVIGFALGVEYDLIAFFVARYFGMRSYTAIYGVLYVCFALGAGFGPLVFGLAYDHAGSYHGSLQISAGVLIVAALSLLLLGRYRTFETAAVSIDSD